MLNRIVLIGRLVRDPELRYTQSGKANCTFTLAVDRVFKDANGERQTDFIDIVVWGKIAESSANYLSKGKLAAVDGRLQIRTYEAKDGSKRKAAEVVAETVRFLTPVGISNPKAENEDKPFGPGPTEEAPIMNPFAPNSDSGPTYEEDELPF